MVLEGEEEEVEESTADQQVPPGDVEGASAVVELGSTIRSGGTAEYLSDLLGDGGDDDEAIAGRQRLEG